MTQVLLSGDERFRHSSLLVYLRSNQWKPLVRDEVHSDPFLMIVAYRSIVILKGTYSPSQGASDPTIPLIA